MGSAGGRGRPALIRQLAPAPAERDLATGGPGWSRRAPDALAMLSVVVATGLFLQMSRPMWFFGDDWDFLLRRGTVPDADLGLWHPHNEHWSTGPVLIYKAIFNVVGLRSYLPYAVPVLIAHAAVALIGYLLLIRIGVGRWPALAVTTVVAFLGAGAENLLWAFQIGFVGSVALGFTALLCYERYERGLWPIWPVWAVLVLALAFSTVGVTMVAFTAAYALFRRGLRGGAVVAVVPAVAFATWFLLVGRPGLGRGPGTGLLATLALLPGYVWTGLTHAWEQVSGIPGSGAAILLVLLGSLLLPGCDRARHLAWAGTLAAFAQLILSGLGRAGLGVEQAAASRYTYLVVVMMAPALAVVLGVVVQRLPRPRWVTAGFALGLLGFVVLNGVHEASAFRSERAALNASMRDRVLASVELAGQGTRILNVLPDASFNPDVTVPLLLSEPVRSRLPLAQPTEQGRLDAAANLQVLVTTGDVPAPAPTGVQLGSGFRGAAIPGSGCHPFQADGPQPTLQVGSGPQGARVTLTTAGTQITTSLAREGLVSDEVPWPVTPGIPHAVVTSAADATMIVRVNGSGAVLLCT